MFDATTSVVKRNALKKMVIWFIEIIPVMFECTNGNWKQVLHIIIVLLDSIILYLNYISCSNKSDSFSGKNR